MQNKTVKFKSFISTISQRNRNMIKRSKIEEQKNNFLNEAQDESQFWHRYNKVLVRKNNNIIEPNFDETLN